MMIIIIKLIIKMISLLIEIVIKLNWFIFLKKKKADDGKQRLFRTG